MEKTVKTSADSSSSSAIVVEPGFTEMIKYRGVRKRKWGKYVSEIRLPNSRERIWLGSYNTAEKAARAFDAALFCLRGNRANFNFPDDPPDIAGGQSLTPAQIQVVAQQYGNSYQPPPPPPPQEGADSGPRPGRLDNASSSSNSAQPGPVDLINDWSFWDMMDNNGGVHNNVGDVSGYGLFPEPGEMYIPPHFEARSNEDEEGCYDSSLWNF